MAVQGIPVDQELKKAFQELQTKMITTRQQLKFSDAQVETLRRQITHSKVLDQEISTLPEDTRTYEGVGRMFMLQPIPEVRKNLTKKIQTSDEKIKSINSNKSYLERSIKESEDNLRELILSKQSHKNPSIEASALNSKRKRNPNHEDKKEFLERNLEEEEANIREMIQMKMKARYD